GGAVRGGHAKKWAAVATTASLIPVPNSARAVPPPVGPLRHFEAGERSACRIREHAPKMTVAPPKRKWLDFRPACRRGRSLAAASARLASKLARKPAQPLDSPTLADSPGHLLPGPRILRGPGPSRADPRVLRAMATPLLGQFDPEFTAVMNEVMELLRIVFQTRNERAFPVPGTGRAGLEAAMVSLLEPGDRVVIGECGRFGLLLIDI